MVIFIIILVSGCVVQIDEEERNNNDNNSNQVSESQENKGNQLSDRPVIENIGVEIGFYDESTGKAGDFKFDTFTYSWGGIYNEKVFYDYGEKIMRENEVVLDPQPIFIVPLGTKVHAITSGNVIAINKLYSNDYTIQIIKPENQDWVYEHEHVINPLVAVGDNVAAGQVIAEVSDYNNWLKEDGYGVLDIGILTSENGKPLHHCPFMYLNESVKQEYFERINALYIAWEEYTGNNSLYEEETYTVPGCITMEPIRR